MGWYLPRVMALCPDHPFYNCVDQVTVPHWSRGRTVLVGDCCQAVSLLAGQGASIALFAAAVLGRELSGVAASKLTSAPESYRLRPGPTVAAKQRGGRWSASWFLPNSTTQLLMRRHLFRAASSPLAARLAHPFLSRPRSRFDPGMQSSPQEVGCCFTRNSMRVDGRYHHVGCCARLS